ncbi:hypothetical protein [Pseudorhodoplanes sp.]|uniref:hypothetical protein n=1 Tax=Pseudorhodoplanes sp. TaxID=1934341 RepID=UPI00391ABF94
MQSFDKIAADLKQLRDEARLKAHLGTMVLKDEWETLERKWETFEARAKLDRSAKDVGAALDLLAQELKTAYERIAKAV